MTDDIDLVTIVVMWTAGLVYSLYLYRLSSLKNTSLASPPSQFLSGESSVLPESLCENLNYKNQIFSTNTDSRLDTRSWEYSSFLWFHLENPGYYNIDECKVGFSGKNINTSPDSSKNMGQKNSCTANIVKDRILFCWFVGLQLLCWASTCEN